MGYPSTRERLAEAEDERKRYLLALYCLRKLLVGHAVKAEHIREAIEVIDGALG